MEPVLDRASIRNANLQALQALKGELASSPNTASETNPQISDDAFSNSHPRGLKRKYEEMVAMDEDPALSDDPGVETPNPPLKVNQDGTVEQVDTVR